MYFYLKVASRVQGEKNALAVTLLTCWQHSLQQAALLKQLSAYRLLTLAQFNTLLWSCQPGAQIPEAWSDTVALSKCYMKQLINNCLVQQSRALGLDIYLFAKDEECFKLHIWFRTIYIIMMPNFGKS